MLSFAATGVVLLLVPRRLCIAAAAVAAAALISWLRTLCRVNSQRRPSFSAVRASSRPCAARRCSFHSPSRSSLSFSLCSSVASLRAFSLFSAARMSARAVSLATSARRATLTASSTTHLQRARGAQGLCPSKGKMQVRRGGHILCIMYPLLFP